MKILGTIIACALTITVFAQNVGINNTDPKAALDINGGIRFRSTPANFFSTSVNLTSNKGYHFLGGAPTGNFTINFTPIPDEGQHAIITNSTGFTGALFSLTIPAATTVELIYSNGGWKQIGSSQPIGTTAWSLTGNIGTDTSINFIGTRDDKPLLFKINNQRAGLVDRGNNTSFGHLAMSSLTLDAGENTAIGGNALKNFKMGNGNVAVGYIASEKNKTGEFNTALGFGALAVDSAGSETVAVGKYALGTNQNRAGNTAVGSYALLYNTHTDLGVITPTQGMHNTAVGYSALFFNRSGSGSIAIGYGAAYKDTKADGVIAIGRAALYNSINRIGNVAIGDSALTNNGIGAIDNEASANTAVGYKTLLANTKGTANTVFGSNSLWKNTTGIGNTAIGNASLVNNNGDVNTAVGISSLSNNTSGNGNTAIGTLALSSNSTGNQNSAVGYWAAHHNTTGFANVAIGTKALYYNSIKSNLVAIGDSALFSNGTGVHSHLGVYATSNTAVGSKSLYKNSSGYSNTALGSKSATNNEDGQANTAIGSDALRSNIEGTSNTGLGAFALVSALGDSNTAIGSYAGFSIFYGDRNTIVGANTISSPFFSRTISGSTFVGYNAGNTETTNNKLYIENSNADKNNALIYGDFAADSLLLNAKTINKYSLNVRGNYPLEIGYGTAGKQVDAGKLCYGCFGDPAHWLGIVGGGTAALGGDRVIKLWSEGGLRIKGNALPDFDNVYSLGTSGQRWKEVWTNAGTINTSDANLKTNIATSPYGLSEVMQMNPVQYNWKTNPGEDLQIGFLAQDIQKIIPEAVVVPTNGDPLGMKYTELIPVLVKAIQELKTENEQYKKRIEKLEANKK